MLKVSDLRVRRSNVDGHSMHDHCQTRPNGSRCDGVYSQQVPLSRERSNWPVEVDVCVAGAAGAGLNGFACGLNIDELKPRSQEGVRRAVAIAGSWQWIPCEGRRELRPCNGVDQQYPTV